MDSRAAFQLVTVNAETSDDISGIYNILYHHLFDRRRDLCLPISFLIDEGGDIVKVYRGPISEAHVEEDIRRIPRSAAERLSKALPFAGVSTTYEFGRNYLSFGSAFFERGYYEQAEASFRSALRDDPSSAEAHYGLGSVYLKQEKLNDARDSFKRAVKLNGSYPETLPNAWNNLGLLATREGRIDEATGYFQEALKINPNYWIALENIGNAYRQQGRWDEARAALERAIAIQPRDPEVNYNLGMVFAQTDDAGRASEYLRKALQLRPVYPEALNNLGVLYLRTGRRDEAVRTFEECIRVTPGFDQSYLNLARVYVLENARDKARALLRELLRQHPGHAQASKALDQLQ
jgi:Flp pilus assembly protein TadD